MDNLFLTGPSGTVINIGSWLEAEQAVDYGEDGLFEAQYVENPLIEGALLGYENIGVRKMSFPLILASHNSFNGLGGLQTMLRRLARPGGGYIDVQLDQVATADAVRFDVLTGRLQPGYELPVYRGAKRLRARLQLDVKPIGYLPTSIILASSPSLGLPGVLSIPKASIIGDMPGLAAITVLPWGGSQNAATSYAQGSWGFDFLGWSMAARASFSAFWPGASITSGGYFGGGPSLLGDQFAPGSQANEQYFTPGAGGTWYSLFAIWINPNSDSLSRYSYIGRHRVFAWAKSGSPSLNGASGMSAQWLVDMIPLSGQITGRTAMASAQAIATQAPNVASGAPGAWGAQPSPAYQLLDLGEITFPAASTVPADVSQQLVRFWFNFPSVNATYTIRCGGVYLLPLEGQSGLMTRGLQYPTTAAYLGGGNINALSLMLDGQNDRRFTFMPAGIDPQIDASQALAEDADRWHRGEPLPKVGASTIQLDLIGGERHIGSQANMPNASSPLVRAAQSWVAVSVTYKPRFMFLKGL